MVQSRHNRQGKKRHQPVLPGTVVLASCSSCHIVYSGGIQGKTNGKYYRSRDQRREEHPDLPDKKPHYKCYDSANDLGSENRRNSISFSYGLHTGYVGEADTHDHGKSGTDGKPAFFSYGKELDQCGDGRHHKGSLDQDHSVFGIQAAASYRSRYNDRRSHASYDHGNYMLQCQRTGFLQTGDSVQFKNTAFFHGNLLLRYIYG